MFYFVVIYDSDSYATSSSFEAVAFSWALGWVLPFFYIFDSFVLKPNSKSSKSSLSLNLSDFRGEETTFWSFKELYDWLRLYDCFFFGELNRFFKFCSSIPLTPFLLFHKSLSGIYLLLLKSIESWFYAEGFWYWLFYFFVYIES